MFKKILIAMCTFALSASILVSCGSNNDTNNDTSNNTSVDTSNNTNVDTTTVSLSDVRTAVKEAYGESYTAQEQPEEYLQDLVGLDKELYDEAYLEMPLISARTDRFIAVKAKEGKGEEVENVLNKYRDTLVSEGMQYPSNLPLAQASEVVREGDYVFYVLLGEVPFEVQETGDEAQIAQSAKEQIQIGVNAIREALK